MDKASIKDKKKTLRLECVQKAALLPGPYLEKANEAMYELLIQSAIYQNASSLFVYISTDKEPDTRRLIERAWQDRKDVFVPLCHGRGRMDAVRLNDWGALKPGRLGILEPDGPDGLETAQDVDLCVVPCVSASKNGFRLGHGAGYYDRWLREHRAASICLCFERMISESVPYEAWDAPINYVLTENGFSSALQDKA